MLFLSNRLLGGEAVGGVICVLIYTSIVFFATYSSRSGGGGSNARMLVRSDARVTNPRHVRISSMGASFACGKGRCRSSMIHQPSRSLPVIGGRRKRGFISGHVALHVAYNKGRIISGIFAGSGFTSLISTGFVGCSVLRKLICSGAAPRKVVCTTDIYCPRSSLCIPVELAVATSKGVSVTGRRLVRSCRASDVS